MNSINVFTYGTLQLPAVMQAVTGMSYPYVPASLDNFARYKLRNRIYPGIVPCPGSRVEGVVYCSVNHESLMKLDAFEDTLYQRSQVEINIGSGNCSAEVYIVAEDFLDLLTSRDWDIEKFTELHLHRYLKGCERFYQTL